jgi:imidazolonepropionase-like amidohydrolase
MLLQMNPALHIRGAIVDEGGHAAPRDLFLRDRVLPAAPAHALRVDLEGCTLIPGQINAHDHLELNHYPRSSTREQYASAHDWGADMNARLNDEPFLSLRAHPLADRLFIGGLKNLFCGATTVAHHNPPHRDLWRRGYPVRVLRRYGWAHSLAFASEAEIRTSYQRTPPEQAWFIHLAEGTDTRAAAEYGRLKALGCVGANTVLIHGVGLTDDDIADAAPKVRGLVWCPSTNAYLLGTTARIAAWAAAGGRWALGSDSRLTADGDLRDEQRAAARAGGLDHAGYDPATLIGMPEAGHLQTGALADCTALRGEQVALVILGGVPQFGDADLMACFPHIRSIPARLNGYEIRLHPALARRIDRCTLRYTGLEIDALPSRWQTFSFRLRNRLSS